LVIQIDMQRQCGASRLGKRLGQSTGDARKTRVSMQLPVRRIDAGYEREQCTPVSAATEARLSGICRRGLDCCVGIDHTATGYDEHIQALLTTLGHGQARRTAEPAG